MEADRTADRDWPEDFAHDNGRYLCNCVKCENTFEGHKRRVCCKLCATAPAAPAEAVEADTRRLDWLNLQDFDELRFAVPVDRPHDGEYEVTDGNGRVFYGKNLRAAIDAAIQAEGGAKK